MANESASSGELSPMSFLRRLQHRLRHRRRKRANVLFKATCWRTSLEKATVADFQESSDAIHSRSLLPSSSERNFCKTEALPPSLARTLHHFGHFYFSYKREKKKKKWSDDIDPRTCYKSRVIRSTEGYNRRTSQQSFPLLCSCPCADLLEQTNVSSYSPRS